MFLYMYFITLICIMAVVFLAARFGDEHISLKRLICPGSLLMMFFVSYSITYTGWFFLDFGLLAIIKGAPLFISSFGLSISLPLLFGKKPFKEDMPGAYIQEHLEGKWFRIISLLFLAIGMIGFQVYKDRELLKFQYIKHIVEARTNQVDDVEKNENERRDEAVSFLLDGRYYSLELLLKEGLNPNFSFNGNTLLSLSLELERYEVTKMLMIYGADPLYIPENGVSPVEKAKELNVSWIFEKSSK